jgi:hypothetical protein
MDPELADVVLLVYGVLVQESAKQIIFINREKKRKNMVAKLESQIL